MQSGREQAATKTSWATNGSLSHFDTLSGRLDSIVQLNADERQLFHYDSAGNTWLTRVAKNPGGGPPTKYDDRVSYYNTLNQLVGAERRVAGSANGDVWDWRQSIETYRYDPLGRRIVVRAFIKCPPFDDNNYGIDCWTGSMRRTVWAGDRELAEIQLPDSTNYWPYPAAKRDSQTLLVPALARRVAGAAFPDNYDPNPQFGWITYVHGMSLDRPLSFTRFGHHDKPLEYGSESGYTWPPVTVIPHWNASGEAATGSFLSGVVRMKVTPHSNHVHEFLVDWELGGPAYSRVKPSVGTVVPWMGTLITQKRDITGTLYRRNRYYDPGTGRFTQPDPIGLAGGLNLYGYAGGDPINFSDPFGLCPRVTVDGDRVLVEARLVRGSGTAADHTRVASGIQQYWGGTVGKYTVTVDLDASGAPEVEVFTHRRGLASGDVGGTSSSRGVNGGGQMMVAAGGNAASTRAMGAHEFGHVFGLTDEDHSPDRRDLMHDQWRGGTRLTQEQLELAIRRCTPQAQTPENQEQAQPRDTEAK